MLLKIFVSAILLTFLFSSNGEATQPSIPSLKMEMSIIHDGNWEVGKETQVTFKFKSLQEVTRRTKQPDEARLVYDSSLVLVSGDTNWSGFLEKGKEYSITIILRPTKPGKFVLAGGVDASLTKIYTDEELRKKEEEYDKKIEQNPELKKMGIKAKFRKKRFFFHNETSSGVNVPGEIPSPDTTWQVINGVKIRSGPGFSPDPGVKIWVPGRPDTVKKIEVTKDSSKISYPPSPK